MRHHEHLPTAEYQVLDPAHHGGMKYRLLKAIHYYSFRYRKYILCKKGMLSDGATMATDLAESLSWWIHDELCESACFEGGTPCTAWQASMVLRDILFEEGHSLRARTWTWATFLFGSWKNKAVCGWYTLRAMLKE